MFYENNQYFKEERTEVPFRYMALEFLIYNEFHIKSDVWSYGVVFWEIFSLSEVPYPGLNSLELLDFLKAGNRLEYPQILNFEGNVPWFTEELFESVTGPCWKRDVKERSSFKEVVKKVESLMQNMEKEEYCKQDQEYREMVEGRSLTVNDVASSSPAPGYSRATVTAPEDPLPLGYSRAAVLAPGSTQNTPNNGYSSLGAIQHDRSNSETSTDSQGDERPPSSPLRAPNGYRPVPNVTVQSGNCSGNGYSTVDSLAQNLCNAGGQTNAISPGTSPQGPGGYVAMAALVQPSSSDNTPPLSSDMHLKRKSPSGSDSHHQADSKRDSGNVPEPSQDLGGYTTVAALVQQSNDNNVQQQNGYSNWAHGSDSGHSDTLIPEGPSQGGGYVTTAALSHVQSQSENSNRVQECDSEQSAAVIAESSQGYVTINDLSPQQSSDLPKSSQGQGYVTMAEMVQRSNEHIPPSSDNGLQESDSGQSDCNHRASDKSIHIIPTEKSATHITTSPSVQTRNGYVTAKPLNGQVSA